MKHPHDDAAPALDEADAALIAAAIAPEPLGAAAHARIKRRLLQRIAADSTPRHLTVQPGPAGWQPFGAGVQLKVLHEAGGVMSYLVRLAPGAALAAHRHPIDEECVVLEGEVVIGELRVGAGGFHLGRREVLHDHVRSDGGALIFLRGAPPELETLL
jgi:quercetin dioxygenase-like cupin family protein